MGEKGLYKMAAKINSQSSQSCQQLQAIVAVPQGREIHVSSGTTGHWCCIDTPLWTLPNATALSKGRAYRRQVIDGILV